MALDGLRTELAGRGEPDPGGWPQPGPLLFGRNGTAVVPCPACGSSIPRGSRSCPNCAARLVLGVTVAKASLLLSIGLVVGLVVGGGLMGLVGAVQPRPGTASGPGPAGGGGGTTASGQPTVAATIPVTAAAALRGSTEINVRLAVASTSLADALDGRFSVTDVAKILRRMNTDVRAGAGIVPAFRSWEAGAAHQAALADFYDRLEGVIGDGLDASIRSESAYRSAARAVLRVLQNLPALDAEGRSLAATYGVALTSPTLPPIPKP